MSETNDRGPADPIGTVADEARKLFDAIQGRATRHVGRTVLNSFTGGGGGGRRERDVWGEAVAEPEEEYICRACPVCRAIAAQREPGNDVTSHLVAAGGELFAAFRQTLDVLSRPAPHGPRTAGGQGAREQDGREQGSREQGVREQGAREQDGREQGSREQGVREQGVREQGSGHGAPRRDDGPATGHDQHGRDSVQHIDLG
ncbi:hypothetical protein ACGF0J_25210 [Nonomuraea sp. NPDC047897]|uniref:hypothetical protein n=1 Tax=Nonomuraea sp. NPDC047897 TaxID=3364346 RepID=UPI003716D3F6